jgi:AraC family transcriptional regulator of adaptative response / DNA-3-methyladenine glycosylase II
MISATILKYKPPLDWNRLLSFLAPRAIRNVEHVNVEALTLRRSLHFQGQSGWLECRIDTTQHHIHLQHSSQLPTHEIEAKATRVFDLTAPVEALETLFPGHAGLRVPGAWDSFEMGVRAILGQQVSVKAAHTLAARLVENWGDAIDTPWPEISRVFPAPDRLAKLQATDLRSIGLTEARAQTLLSFAQWSALAPTQRPPLLSLRGIGPWTESYFRMRSGEDRDAFPAGDLGVQKALALEKPGSPRAQKQALEAAEAWRPLRSYAVMLLWSSLSAK